jgi:hypothetical protein
MAIPYGKGDIQISHAYNTICDRESKKTTKDTLDSNHALHQSLIGKTEGIRLPAKKP